MKFDSGKAWPYPVLRPPDCGDDYPDDAFEVSIELERLDSGISVKLSATFYLQNKDLTQLISSGKAAFALLLRSPRTHYRNLIIAKSGEIKREFRKGELGGRVEFYPILIALEELNNLSFTSWHEDYTGVKFDILSGSILAEDTPKDYWIYPSSETPLGSIFIHNTAENIADHQWDLNYDGGKVEILMSESTFDALNVVCDKVNGTPEAQYVINGLYLPILATTLYFADENMEECGDCRWFSALDEKLGQLKLPLLGKKGADRHLHAQQILDSPFGELLATLVPPEEV